MSVVDVLPCPACGGRAKLTKVPARGSQVRCGRCFMRGPLGSVKATGHRYAVGFQEWRAEQDAYAVREWNDLPRRPS